MTFPTLPPLAPLPPFAYVTEHDDHPRLWLDVLEARMYVECGEEPQALVLASDVTAIRLADRQAMLEWAASQVDARKPQNEVSDWTEFARIRNEVLSECAASIRAALRSSLKAAESLVGLYCEQRDIHHGAACSRQCHTCAESNGTAAESATDDGALPAKEQCLSAFPDSCDWPECACPGGEQEMKRG